MARLKMFDPAKASGLRILGSIMEEKGLKMAPPIRTTKATGRDADPRRVLPLQGRTWQKLRAAVLAEEPLCRDCAKLGLIEPATDLDHASGDPSDNSRENLAPLCHPCHSRKTAASKGKRTRPATGLDGLPATGPWSTKP